MEEELAIVFCKKSSENRFIETIGSVKATQLLVLTDKAEGNVRDLIEESNAKSKLEPKECVGIVPIPENINDLPYVVRNELESLPNVTKMCIYLASASPCEAYQMSIIHLMTNAKVYCGDNSTAAKSIGEMILSHRDQLVILEGYKDGMPFNESDLRENRHGKLSKKISSGASKRIKELTNRGLLEPVVTGMNTKVRKVTTKGQISVDICTNIKHLDVAEQEKNDPLT